MALVYQVSLIFVLVSRLPRYVIRSREDPIIKVCPLLSLSAKIISGFVWSTGECLLDKILFSGLKFIQEVEFVYLPLHCMPIIFASRPFLVP